MVFGCRYPRQVFAAFKSIAPFVHNMMPCRRIDRITRTAYESNVNWLARMALLVLTDVLSAPLQLKRLEHRVLTLGSHLGFNFARGGVLDPKWCASPELAASNANVVAKLKKDVEVDGYVSDGLCSPADQLRISQMCHTIEFGCIFTILDKAPGVCALVHVAQPRSPRAAHAAVPCCLASSVCRQTAPLPQRRPCIPSPIAYCDRAFFKGRGGEKGHLPQVG